MKNLAIIGARLSSSRLPRKHLLPLGGKPLILRVIQCLEQVKEVDLCVVATTSEEVNKSLIDLLQAKGKHVFAYDGPTSDLVGRIATLVAQKKPENIIYVCGDTPLIRPQLVQNLLAAAIKEPSKKPTLVTAPKGEKWIHEGIDVFPMHIFEIMVNASVLPHHREHFGSVLHEIPHQKSIVVEDSDFASSTSLRLSIDTQADYQLMNQLFSEWETKHKNQAIDFEWAIQFLKGQKGNAHVRQRVIQDQNSQTLNILTACGPNIGLGHISRSAVLARALIEHFSYGVKVWILGNPIPFPALSFLNHQFVKDIPNHEGHWIIDTPFSTLESHKKVIIDPKTTIQKGDLAVYPSFFAHKKKAIGGWPYYLISPDIQVTSSHQEGLVVLSGGSDALKLGENLGPTLPNLMPTTWVQGPLAPEPKVPPFVKVLKNPNIVDVLRKNSWAITPYGVSFFECLQAGLKTIVIKDRRMPDEMKALENEKVAFVVGTPNQAVELLKNQPKEATLWRQNALKKMDGRGPYRVAEAIHHWVQT